MSYRFDLTPRLMALVRESRQRAPGGADARPALSLVGSIGFASYLTDAGEVWIEEGIFDEEWVWRRAGLREAFGCLRSAARRLPVLAVLLPIRDATDLPCEECSGTGTYRNTPVWCLACFGLGWLPPLLAR